MTADDWMGIGYAFVVIAYFYIRYFNPGLLRCGLHTLLARYYNLIALLTDTRGFVFALLVYGLLHRAAQTLLHVVTTPFDRRQLTSTVSTPSPVSSPSNSVLDGWIEQDGEEAWRQRMTSVMEKKDYDEEKEKEEEPEEDSLAFLLPPANDHHASPNRRLSRKPQKLYLVSV